MTDDKPVHPCIFQDIPEKSQCVYNEVLAQWSGSSNQINMNKMINENVPYEELVLQTIVNSIITNENVFNDLSISDSLLVVSHTLMLLLQNNFIDTKMANKIMSTFKLPDIIMQQSQQEQEQEE